MAKNSNEERHNEENRNKVIVKTSIVGIVTNVILASVKAVIGLMANSIAVVLDAVNNLSDALSSIITIVGNKLSRKLPNEKHPLGYGRIEYLTAMVIASIVIYAGITSCVESVKKIIHPRQQLRHFRRPAFCRRQIALGQRERLRRHHGLGSFTRLHRRRRESDS